MESIVRLLNESKPVSSEVQRPDFIPASRWNDPERTRLERERLWPRIWHMACREEELVSVGAFVNYQILDESILVVRTGDGPDDLIAYYNVCQHRGRRLRTEAKGQLGRTINCRFHGWQWTIDGKIASVFQKGDWKGCAHFNDEALALPKVKVARWGGWIWINQDENAEPLLDYLGEAAVRLDAFDPKAMRALWWKTIIAPVNWKVVVEAFNEGYHVWSTHSMGVNYSTLSTGSKTFGEHSMFHPRMKEGRLFSEYKTEDGSWKLAETLPEFMWAVERQTYRFLGAMTLDTGMRAVERAKELPADIPFMDYMATLWKYRREEIEATGAAWPETLTPETFEAGGTDWHIFPNTILLPTPDGALWYRIRPDGDNPDSCIFDIWSFGRFAPGKEPKVEQEIYHGFEAFRGQCPFLEEDFQNMEAVNAGMKSHGWKGARTNPIEEVPVNHFHAVLDRYLSDPA